MKSIAPVAALVLGLVACSHAPEPQRSHAPEPQHSHASEPQHSHAGSPASDEGALDAVAAVHGGAGPWAVAGYRMGEFALEQLGLKRGDFDLEIIHFTPREVQYACIADGAAAATGASVGKLNLTLAEAPAPETRTTYRNRSTGQTIVLRLTEAFKTRFLDVPRERLGEAGREVLHLDNDEIFEIVP